MPRRVLLGKELRAELLIGVNTLADAVKSTLGPAGRAGILERNPLWPPHITLDGVSIAKEVRDLESPWQNAGAALVRGAADHTSEEAGDGTTTSTLLAQVIFQKGLEYLDKGANPVALKRGIDKAVAVVVDHIVEIAQDVDSDAQVAQIGTLSAHGDSSIGTLIADAMHRVGRDGVITISDSTDEETTLQVSEGMQIDRGWFPLHPFVTDPERLQTILRQPFILLTERKMFTMTEEVGAVLAQAGQSGRPVLVVVGDYDQPFVVTLIHNKQLGQLQSVVVKAPAFGDLRRAILEDLATVTGAYAFTENCGRDLASIRIDDLGQATQVTVDQASTTIVGGYGDEDAKQARMTLLRSLIEATENELQREQLRQRLARLASGVAVIKVGAVTDAERAEKRDRVDDAVCATKAAVEEGIVPGGGSSLLSAVPEVELLMLSLDGDERIGARIIREALEAPIRQICANAGVNSNPIVKALLAGNSWPTCREHVSAYWWALWHWKFGCWAPIVFDDSWGYNAATDAYEDLIYSGVIDPTKVVRCALQNAASVAALMLTTEAMVATFAKEKS